MNSFWQAGYEGADHRNHQGVPQDMNHVTGHLQRARDDYQLLRQFGIATVRESAGWRLCERGGQFDFSHLDSRLHAAADLGIEICWTFCHYGWPDDVDVFGPDFVPRFVRYCQALARYLAPWSGAVPVYSPINEVSFTSWGLSIRMFHCRNMHDAHAGDQGKRQLVRAQLAACDAIRDISPGARFLVADPLIHVIAPEHRPDWAAQAADWRASQFEAWDMLCGRATPELGGAPHYVDLIGANYYHSNQWESGSNLRLWWHLGEPRRTPLHRLLLELHHRYERPLLLAETSHVGSGRGAWLRDVASEAALAVQHGADLWGICLYPAIDRPDWEHPQHWHHSGLWDLDRAGADPLARVLVAPYAAALHQSQQLTERLCRAPNNQENAMPTIVVFSHLRWDFVYQRPQQLLTRLAPYFRIIYVEEPLHSDGPPHLSTSTPAPNVTVVQPHTPSSAAGFHDDQIPLLQPLLAALAPPGEDVIAWFYTPMALPLLQTLPARLVVYDCMDELSAFLHAPRQLLQRETALLKIADLVFAGGPSLYNARRARHPNAHCFPSSVDAIHFQQALDRGNGHPLHAEIPRPRLGYYGVIDERFDAALLAALADAQPDWQLVIVGPVLKIAPASLPQRENIHYLGQQPYQALPHFLAGWDVCLLPFALNQATRNISPTKVLEYMAAELPIVSTAITDVEQPYGGVVAIGHDHAGFIAACEAALAQTPQQRAALAQRMREIVGQTSWQATADAMRQLIEQAPPGNTAGRTAALSAPPAPLTPTSPPPPISSQSCPPPPALSTAALMAPSSPPAAQPGAAPVPAAAMAHAGTRGGAHTGCIVIGAGPTGLSAAYHLDADTLLLERAASVGGWCRSIQDHGFTFDHAGHIMFSDDPYVLKLYDILLGDNQHWQMREAWIYSKQVYTRYPFQGSLHGLPPEVIRECIMGAVEARYTAPATRAASVPGATPVADCCADGTTDTSSAPRALPVRPPNNFEDFIYKVWGAGIARHFALPYNRKLWTIPLKEMETSWLGGRVPLPDLDEIVEGALQPTPRPMGPNARFGYPRRGGFQALMSGFLPHIRGKVELNAEVSAVLPHEHTLMLADGRLLHYDHLISTMPMPELVRLMGDAVPVSLKLAAGALRHVSIRCVNIGVNRPNLTDKHWIYYPEDTVYHRIFVQGNASPDCNPPGGFGFTCEISYSPSKPLPADGDTLIAQCLADCVRTGFLSEDDKVLTANQADMPYAYVVYDHARAGNVAAIREWMARHDILLAGRYSEWEYYNSDHAFLAGKRAAESVRAQRTSRTRAAVST